MHVIPEEQGLVVLEATNAWQAPQAIRGDRPDLVILNLRLPDRDGLAVLQDPRLESGRLFVILSTGTEQADELLAVVC